MSRKLFHKKAAQAQDMSLNITAMADIFTVLLVFLLKSFTTSAVTLSPSAGLVLPEVFSSNQVPTDALKVEISSTAVLIENQPVLDLKDYQFAMGDMDGNKTSKSLSQALAKERKRQMTIAQANSQVKIDPKILIVADQKAPYSTIKTVLASAAVNGYTDFKLAVVQNQ